MKIHKSIDTDHVYLGLEAEDMDGALETISEVISQGLGVPETTVYRALKEREALGSTSVGEGFAIPHCKLPGLKHIRIALARFEGGVPFGVPDGEPVEFFFVVLSPPEQPALHLQVLSQIARVLKRRELRTELLTAVDPEGVLDAVRRVAETEGL